MTIFGKGAYSPMEGATQKGATVGSSSSSGVGRVGIRYEPDLISRFEGHHATLKKLLTSMKAHAANDEFNEAQNCMHAFRRALTTHLLEENLKLYRYLSQCLADSPDDRVLVSSMKTEMGGIGTAVMHFISQYAESGITPFNKQSFLDGLDRVGKALMDRIGREESSLYALYMPPASFRS